MLKSMTGFGKSQTDFDNGELNIEVRTLNSKFADVALKFPSAFSDFEHDIKKAVTDVLIRGKISVVIEQPGQSNTQGVYNHEAIKSTFNELKGLADSIGATSDKLLELAVQAPGSLESSDDKYGEKKFNELKSVLVAALNDCDSFRLKEGEELSKKLTSYVNSIDELLEKVAEFEPERTKKVEDRLKSNLADLESSQNVEADKNRFEQELIYYIEKYDISEEKVRLKQHINYFIEVMEGESASGKKLGFISQEMGREINTLGSKANHADIQRLVVQMKEELEKIKEQVLNVL